MSIFPTRLPNNKPVIREWSGAQLAHPGEQVHIVQLQGRTAGTGHRTPSLRTLELLQNLPRQGRALQRL